MCPTISTEQADAEPMKQIPGLPRRLADKHMQTMAAIREHQVPVWFLGCHPVFEGTQFFEEEKTRWALMNLSEDSGYKMNGNRLAVPDRVKRQIQAIADTGIDFDAIFIAHELPTEIVSECKDIPRDLISPIPPGLERSRTLGNHAQRFWQAVGKVAYFSAAGAIALPVLTASALTSPLLMIADPILFGINFDPSWKFKDRPIGMWYEIARWDWKVLG